ncbi:metallophosphoesterase [Anaerocolumna chitinilytica]|uniref:Serine/threonine protein phosphatase n=1 Tax=Anaerocolumna chitinilytica TaxID=1727145 RepID=A0A7I8DM84_9FIRM|nr:metallophosphoesterase [Anaerocolumna chitinilytica]BCJ99553.1 serine/threonine protein phosphatase [Anaerocolumna chitinilytica]
MSSKNIRQLLTLCFSISFLLTGCSNYKATPIESGKDLSLFVTSDVHYLANSVHDDGKAFQDYCTNSDGRMLYYSDDIINAFGADVQEDKPDILIISGDLTTNGEKQSHLSLADKLKNIEKTSGTKVYVIPGNHDIENPWARGFKGDERYKIDSISAADFSKIYKDFGYGEAISRDSGSLSYLAAPSDDVWLLMLDTCEYRLNKNAGIPVTNGEIKDTTLKWIKKCSKMAKKNNARIITVMHHNLYNHSSKIYYGFTLDNSNEVEKVFRECNLNLVLSGHLHIQDIRHGGEGNERIYDIATESLLMYPIQYGIINYSPLKGFDYNTTQVNVEDWAKKNGIKDSNLTDFMAFSRLFLTDNSYNKAYNAVSQTGLYSEEDAKDMAETISFINVNYIKGTVADVLADVEASNGYKLWLKADGIEAIENLRAYLLSMIPHTENDNNHLHLN